MGNGGRGREGARGRWRAQSTQTATLRAPVPPPAATGVQPPTPHDHLRMARGVMGRGGRGHTGAGGLPAQVPTGVSDLLPP